MPHLCFSREIRICSYTCIMIWVRSRNCGCLVTWFCYHLIANQVTRQPQFRDMTHMVLIYSSDICFLCCFREIFIYSTVASYRRTTQDHGVECWTFTGLLEIHVWTHWSLVKPFAVIEFGSTIQHMFRWWLVSCALQNNLAKICNVRNHIYGDNFKLKFCMCTQSIALGTRTKFQLKICMRNMISAIHKFWQNILKSLWYQTITWTNVDSWVRSSGILIRGN